MITPAGRKILIPLGFSIGGETPRGWWIIDGLFNSDCVAAYIFKGAADLSTALKDQHNSYDLTLIAGSDATLMTDGLQFSGSNAYRCNGLYQSSIQSAIIRYKSSSGKAFFGSAETNIIFVLGMASSSLISWFCNGGSAISNISGKNTTGIMAMLGDEGYKNLTSVGTIAYGNKSSQNARMVAVGAEMYGNDDSSVTNILGANSIITCILFYSKILSYSEYETIYNLMAAL